MEDALKALADMKTAGASMDDREAKLISTEAQLQNLLFNRVPATREETGPIPVSSHLLS